MTWIWPLTGPITCDFACHVAEGRTPGLDIAIPTGTPIHASRGGSVMISQFDPTAGNYVQIDHGDSISRYLHQSRLDVIVGQAVIQGQQLGLSGTTGNSTGPHLHWDIGYKSEAVAKAIQPDPVFKFNRWFVDPELLLQEDWFDMATKEELREIIREELGINKHWIDDYNLWVTRAIEDHTRVVIQDELKKLKLETAE